MTKAFKKGDEVTLIGSWDSKGTIWVREAIVGSCGTKRMALMDAETGACLGRNFEPVRATESAVLDNWKVLTFSRLPSVEGHEIAMECGAKTVGSRRAILEARIENLRNGTEVATYKDVYLKHRIEELEALHEPRVMYRTGERVLGF